MGIVKHIPNTITCLNLISGAISIIFSFQGNFLYAFLFMILAAVFDFCDGLSARLLHAPSSIGKELDSLSDDISFGLAPALILYNYMKGVDDIHPFICFIPLIIAAFSALRLAKFNLDPRQSTGFIGLPTPACALFIGALISFATTPSGAWLQGCLNNNYVLPALSAVLSWLLVSEVPMFSMKMKSLKWADNRPRYIFLICIIPISILCIILHFNWSAVPFFIFLLYIIWNLAAGLFHK